MEITKVNQIQQFNYSKFKHLLHAFLKAQDISDSSKRTYAKSLIEFFRYIGDHQIINPTRETIIDYKKNIMDKGLSPTTGNAYLTACRRFFVWTDYTGLYPDITKGVKSFRNGSDFKKDCLTEQQEFLLLQKVVSVPGTRGIRDHALINLMLGLGLREIEIVRLTFQDIRQVQNRTCLFIHGKGRTSADEYKILTDDLLKPLQEYLRTRTGIKKDDPLFVSTSNRNYNMAMTTNSISRIGKQYLRSIGVNSPTITMHSLRHTSITRTAELPDVSPYDVQEFARHKDLNTSIRYIHRVKRFKDAIEDKLCKVRQARLKKLTLANC